MQNICLEDLQFDAPSRLQSPTRARRTSRPPRRRRLDFTWVPVTIALMGAVTTLCVVAAHLAHRSQPQRRLPKAIQTTVAQHEPVVMPAAEKPAAPSHQARPARRVDHTDSPPSPLDSVGNQALQVVHSNPAPQPVLPVTPSARQSPNDAMFATFEAFGNAAASVTNRPMQDTAVGGHVLGADDPKLAYDGRYPKSALRVEIEQLSRKRDIPSLQAWGAIKVRLASAGLTLNDADWAEHHFKNNLPTAGFTLEQQRKYTQFLRLTADGF